MNTAFVDIDQYFGSTETEGAFDQFEIGTGQQDQDDFDLDQLDNPTFFATTGSTGIAIPEASALELTSSNFTTPEKTPAATKPSEDVQNLPLTPPESTPGTIPAAAVPELEFGNFTTPGKTSYAAKSAKKFENLPLTPTKSIPDNRPQLHQAKKMPVWLENHLASQPPVLNPPAKAAPPPSPVPTPPAKTDSKLAANFVKIATGIPYTALMAILKPQNKVTVNRHVVRVLDSFLSSGLHDRGSIPAPFRSGMDSLLNKITTDDAALKYLVTWFIERVLPTLEENGATDVITMNQIAEFDSEYSGLESLESAKDMILREFNKHIQLVGALERKTNDQSQRIEALEAQLNAANARFDLQNETMRGMEVELTEKKVHIKNQQELIDHHRRDNNQQSKMLNRRGDSYSAMCADHEANPTGQGGTNRNQQAQNGYCPDYPPSDLNSFFHQQPTTNQNQQVQNGYYQEHPQWAPKSVLPQREHQNYQQMATAQAIAQPPITPPRGKKRKAEVVETDWFICHMETKPGSKIICGGLNEKMIKKKGMQSTLRSKCKHCGRNTWAQFKEWVSPADMMNPSQNQGQATPPYERPNPQLSNYRQSPLANIPEPLPVQPVQQQVANSYGITGFYSTPEAPFAAPAMAQPQLANQVDTTESYLALEDPFSASAMAQFQATSQYGMNESYPGLEDPLAAPAMAQPQLANQLKMNESHPALEVPAPAMAQPQVSTYKHNPMVRTAAYGSMMMPTHPDGSL